MTSGNGGLEVGLEAELASFAALLPASPYTSAEQAVIPGQLDLLQLLDPTASNDPKEHQ